MTVPGESMCCDATTMASSVWQVYTRREKYPNSSRPALGGCGLNLCFLMLCRNVTLRLGGAILLRNAGLQFLLVLLHWNFCKNVVNFLQGLAIGLY